MSVNSNHTLTMSEFGKRLSVFEENNFSFEVVFDKNIFELSNPIIKHYCDQRKCLVIISETIKQLYFSEIDSYFRTFCKDNYKIITIKTTEQNKNIQNVLQICKLGKDFGLDRKSLMVAIGGGILLDIVGFSSSMFKRRLDYLRIPTTLLGQIDAGIGIKTGVNFDGTKNYIGSFYPSIATINDISLLKTLPREHLLCGLAEIIKMAIIVDGNLFNMIESSYVDLIKFRYQKDFKIATEINMRAVNLMLEILHENFYENKLERLVDFGHTFSPFIEEYSNFEINHGLAVAMDIAISTEISLLTNNISLEARNRILSLLLQVGYELYNDQTFLPDLMWDSLDIIILHRGRKLNLVIPTDVGRACFINDIEKISPQLLKKAFNNLQTIQNQYLSGTNFNDLAKEEGES